MTDIIIPQQVRFSSLEYYYNAEVRIVELLLFVVRVQYHVTRFQVYLLATHIQKIIQ